MYSRLQKIFQNNFKYPEELLKEKILLAEEIKLNYGDYFFKNEEFRYLIKKYEEAIWEANHLLETFKSYAECFKCTVIEGKGCCKAGLENEASVAIVLLNLFLEKNIPRTREFPGKCFFVGERGCRIFARPSLCREFFCKRLLNGFTQEEYVKISQAIAEELTLQDLLVRYIKKELQFLTGDFWFEIDLTGY